MARKSCFTISEIAKEFKVKKSHIRSYEKKGLISPGNDKLGRRIYNPHDRARLALIFHFELLDYSPDQISELIGIPDVNLDRMEQFRKSLEYGEKKLDELEKRSKEIKFPDRISVMNEINMMREYAEALKNIDPLKSVTEKKLKRKHIRMIPVYVGLSLVLIIAGYFFYPGGKTLNLAQKKPPKTEASPVYRYLVPPDDTGDRQNAASQPRETPESPLPIQGDSFIEDSKELVNKAPIKDTSETVILSQTAPNIGVEKVPLEKTFPSVKETAKAEKEEKIIQADAEISSSRVATISNAQTTAPANKEKAAVAKIEEAQQPKIVAPAVSVHKETLSVPEHQETVSPEDKQTLDTQVNEDAAVKLQHIDSNVTWLTPANAASDENEQTDNKPLTLSHVEKTKLNTVQDKTQLDNYTVFLYYTSEKNKELMEYLAILLQLEGFGVLGIEKVDYQNNDIRYFHREDRAGALLLQKYSTRFISPFMNLEDTIIKIKDLSQKYPNVRKGVLEVWFNNNFLR